MADRRLFTICTPMRLTPEMCEVLRVISEQFDKPVLRQRSDGLVIYVQSWSRLTP